jgi:galactokinase
MRFSGKKQNMVHDKIYQYYKQLFQEEPLLASSPGRINLIGEHTDYNEGFVLPGAINKRIYVAIGLNNTKMCNIHALDLKEEHSFPINQQKPVKKQWVNYFIGVLNEIMKEKTFERKGFNCVFGGNLPIGAGLSSSAALETSFATALNELFGIGLSENQIIHLSQKAEHNFVGLQCGIMDQFAAVKGKANHVLKLDCRSLEYTYYPLELQKYKLLIIDSKVKHSLASSEYNVRRKQVEQAVKTIKIQHPEIKALRDISRHLLDQFKHQLPEETYNRCLYVLNENERVHQTCKILEAGNIEEIGDILYKGQQGLSEMYEVSCPEIDFLIEFTRNKPAVVGSRMMGGGFGGCTINLVEKSYAETLKNGALTSYHKKFGIKPAFYEVMLDEGSKIH